MQILRNLFNLTSPARYSIAALPDAEHNEKLLDIWNELDTQLDIKVPFANPIPHLTHIQAEEIEGDKLKDAMREFARSQAPYTLSVSGLGIFTGQKSAVYLNIVRNPALNRIQSRIIDKLYPAVEGISETHLINYWMPHLTLVMPNMGSNRLPEIIRLLAGRDFAWKIAVNQLAVLDSSDRSFNPYFKVTLSGDIS